MAHVLTCAMCDAAGLPGGLLSQAQLARLGEMAVTAGLQAAGLQVGCLSCCAAMCPGYNAGLLCNMAGMWARRSVGTA